MTMYQKFHWETLNSKSIKMVVTLKSVFLVQFLIIRKDS